MNIKNSLLERIHEDASSRVWTAVDFLDLGNRDAIDKSLQRLVKTKQLRRIDRGLYDDPKVNSLTGLTEAPDYKKVIEAVARRDQVRILIDGLTSANDLGLTNAVPGQVLILTDGRLRPIKIQNLIIRFKHTAPSKLFWAGRPAVRIVQALHWLKDVVKTDEKAERQIIKMKLMAYLKDSTQKNVLLDDLQSGLFTLPMWMQLFLKEIISLIDHK